MNKRVTTLTIAGPKNDGSKVSKKTNEKKKKGQAKKAQPSQGGKQGKKAGGKGMVKQ